MQRVYKLLLISLLMLLSISAAHAQDEFQFAPGDWILITNWGIPVYAQADTGSTQIGELVAGWRTRITATVEGADGGHWLFLETGAYGWIKGEDGFVHYSDQIIAQMIEDTSNEIEDKPDDLTLYVTRATAYASLNQYDAALVDYTYAIDHSVEDVDPIKARALVFRGLVYLDMRSYDIAIEDILNGLGIGYYFPSTYSRFASGYEGARDYQASLDIHLDNVRRAPDWGLVYNNIAVSYHQLEDYNSALDYFGQALELAPQQALSYSSRALVYEDLGDDGAMLNDLNTSIAVDPFCSICYGRRGIYFDQRGDINSALADYSQAIQVDPRNSLAHNDRGVLYQGLGDDESAIGNFLTAVEIDSHNIIAWYNLAGSYGHLGQYEESLNAYNQTEFVGDRFDTSLLLYRPQVHAALGDYDNALIDINEYISRDSSDRRTDFQATSYLVRAYIYLNLGDYAAAEQDYVSAFNVYYDFAQQYYSFGSGYRTTRPREDLMLDLEDQVVDNPNDADLRLQLANLYMELGLWEQGIDAFSEYQTLADSPIADLDQIIETMQSLIR